MERVPFRHMGMRLRVRQTQQRSVLRGAILFTLVLGLAGLLCLTQAVFSEPLHARAGLTTTVAPFKGRPHTDPKAHAHLQASSHPDDDGVPTVQTAVPTGTEQPGTWSGGQAGPGGGTQAPDAPPAGCRGGAEECWWGPCSSLAWSSCSSSAARRVRSPHRCSFLQHSKPGKPG